MIPEAEAFKLANEAEKAATVLRKELELDVAIAKRGGDEAEIKAAVEAEGEQLSEWAKLYRERREAALLLLKALDIAPDDLKYAL